METLQFKVQNNIFVFAEGFRDYQTTKSIRNRMTNAPQMNIFLLHIIVRRNLAVHRSVTPFVIRQPIWRPRLLKRVYKPMRTSHWYERTCRTQE